MASKLATSASRAFTLAEVLITLGIIGVVAAMTIPNLMAGYKAAKLRSQFNKSYSVIQQAFRQMKADEISTDSSDYVNNSGSFYNTFKVYFSGVHDCGFYSNTSSVLPCAGAYPTYKTLDGNSTVYRNWFDDGQFALADGTLIFLENPTSESNHVYILVDLNGDAQKPNRLGYDLFIFQFVDEEIVAMGDPKSDYSDVSKYCDINTSGTYSGMACTQKAKNDADYFKWAVRNIK